MPAHPQENQLHISSEVNPEEYRQVCQGLYQHNVDKTSGLLKEPGVGIKLILRDNRGQVLGGIFCDTFLYCLYIDVLWVAEELRGAGYGKALIVEAERIARENGCTFAHTCTFTYQSPGFYQHLGYEVFAVLADYPQNIKQYFLKKRL